MVTLALEIFLSIVDRRDELRRLVPMVPGVAEELGVVEELVEALAGSNDGPALEKHIADLSRSSPIRSLH